MKTIPAVGNCPFRITAVERIAGDAGIVAQVLARAQTIAAVPARVPDPWHADAIADRKARNAGAERRDGTNDFMPGNHRLFRMRQFVIDQMQIGR